MRYFGGKARIGKSIAEVINTLNGTYWEPFCGMFSVGKYVKHRRIATDLHTDLIMLLKAIRDGWLPPEAVTEDEYNQLKTAEPSPLRAFAGFGCSNSGKFFGGYARESSGRNFAKNAASSLEKLRPMIQGVDFRCVEYSSNIPADIIYCDPPYDGTCGFTVGKFSSEDFWQWATKRSRDSIVLVSEYNAPRNFSVVWAKRVNTDMNSAKGKLQRVENLYVHDCNLFLFDFSKLCAIL
jgi:DNA adenine methylase